MQKEACSVLRCCIFDRDTGMSVMQMNAVYQLFTSSNITHTSHSLTYNNGHLKQKALAELMKNKPSHIICIFYVNAQSLQLRLGRSDYGAASRNPLPDKERHVGSQARLFVKHTDAQQDGFFVDQDLCIHETDIENRQHTIFGEIPTYMLLPSPNLQSPAVPHQERFLTQPKARAVQRQNE